MLCKINGNFLSSINSDGVWSNTGYGMFVKPGNEVLVHIPFPAPMITDSKGPSVKTMYIQYSASYPATVTSYTIWSGNTLLHSITTSDANPGVNLRTIPAGITTRTIQLPSYTQFNSGSAVIVADITNPSTYENIIGIIGHGEVLEYS